MSLSSAEFNELLRLRYQNEALVGRVESLLEENGKLVNENLALRGMIPVKVRVTELASTMNTVLHASIAVEDSVLQTVQLPTREVRRELARQIGTMLADKVVRMIP